MPGKRYTICRDFTCGNVVQGGGYCEQHKEQAHGLWSRPTTKRQSRSKAGYNRAWIAASRQWMAKHPLCADCASRGVDTPAECVDHIKDHKGDRVLFWDRSNWQSLCRSCHSRKTFRENKAAITGANRGRFAKGFKP